MAVLFVMEKPGTYRVAGPEDVRAEARRLRLIPDLKPPASAVEAPRDLAAFVSTQISGPVEQFLVGYVDAANRTIATEILSVGTNDQTAVYPREVIRKALNHFADGVYVAHNHPTGNPQPSPADREITRHLAAALKTMEIRFLDHLVIGSATGAYFSFCEHGLIN